MLVDVDLITRGAVKVLTQGLEALEIGFIRSEGVIGLWAVHCQERLKLWEAKLEVLELLDKVYQVASFIFQRSTYT